jgi:hypothetical protein
MSQAHRKFKQISSEQRSQIEALIKSNTSMTQIAKIIGRHTSAAFSRFFKILQKPEIHQLVNKMIGSLISQIGQHLPGLGLNIAFDGNMVESLGKGKKRSCNASKKEKKINPDTPQEASICPSNQQDLQGANVTNTEQGKEEVSALESTVGPEKKKRKSSVDLRTESDADFGGKTTTWTDENGNQFKKTQYTYGFKVHVMCDSKYGIPLFEEVSKASVNDGTY